MAVLAIVGLATVPIYGAGAGTDNAKPTIVLVHGDWADGSSWNAVTKRLIDRGYHVLVPPNPLRGPTEDSAYVRSFLETVKGPIVLAAHSYGGFVITNGAVGLTNVKALVYLDAFIPDEGDSLLGLAGTGSCLAADPNKVFNIVPVAGGVDLYLQTAPNPPYPLGGAIYLRVRRGPARRLGAVATRPSRTHGHRHIGCAFPIHDVLCTRG